MLVSSFTLASAVSVLKRSVIADCFATVSIRMANNGGGGDNTSEVSESILSGDGEVQYVLVKSGKYTGKFGRLLSVKKNVNSNTMYYNVYIVDKTGRKCSKEHTTVSFENVSLIHSTEPNSAEPFDLDQILLKCGDSPLNELRKQGQNSSRDLANTTTEAVTKTVSRKSTSSTHASAKSKDTYIADSA